MMRTPLSLTLALILFLSPTISSAAAYGVPKDFTGKMERPVGRMLWKKTRTAMDKEHRRFKKTLLMAVPYKTYRNDHYGLTIGYPSDWQVADNYMDTLVSFISPRAGKNDALTENVNILIQETKGQSLTLGAATEQALSELKGLDNFRLHDSMSQVIGNREARAIIYTSGTDTTLKFKQVWLVHRGNLHIFTFASGLSTFRDYVRHFDRMLGTLKLD